MRSPTLAKVLPLVASLIILASAVPASASILLRGTTTAGNGATATSITIANPAGTLQNDVILVAILLNQATTTAGTASRPPSADRPRAARSASRPVTTVLFSVSPSHRPTGTLVPSVVMA